MRNAWAMTWCGSTALPRSARSPWLHHWHRSPAGCGSGSPKRLVSTTRSTSLKKPRSDLALGGRLILGVRAAPGTEDSMPEILDLLSECAASHPFRHAGDRWTVPAHLEQNVFNLEDLIRVAPAPAQIELPMWVVGAAGRDAGVERGFGFVADVAESPADLATWWATVRSDHPKLVRRLRRTACWTPPVANGRVVLDDAVSQLRVLQESIGLDLVLVTADDETAADAERAGLMRSDLARHARPLVQLDRLPPGLADHWAEAITLSDTDNFEEQNHG